MSANKHKFEQVKLYYLSQFDKHSKEHGLSFNHIHGGRQLNKDWERLVKEGYLFRKRERGQRIGGCGKNLTLLFLTQKGHAYIKTHKFELSKVPDLYSKFTCTNMFWTGPFRTSSWCRILV